jgi:hypothetical protein
MIKNAKRIPSIHTQAINPNKIQKKSSHTLKKNLELHKQKTQQTHIPSNRSEKQIPTKKTFLER